MMRCVIDIEADGLSPTEIFCIVCKDIDTDKVYSFYRGDLKNDFRSFALNVDKWIGHNIIDYDAYHINRLLGTIIQEDNVVDTLVLSRLYDVKLEGGHSLDAWGKRLGFLKTEFNDFSSFSNEMLDYCVNDVHLTHKVFIHLTTLLPLKDFKRSINIEHRIARISRDMHYNGFKFDVATADEMYSELTDELNKIDSALQRLYPPKQVGKKLVPFNPNSSKQVIDVLYENGWKPVNKTTGHKELRRNEPDKKKVERFKKYGWKIDEENLATLPDDAPDAVKAIVRRLIIVTRVRKLDEWYKALNRETNRIHGTFVSLGTWTHRFVHTNPNMANISASKSLKYKTKELNELASDYGKRMRNLWICNSGSHLVGTDAEAIQLRVLAHYVDNKDFTNALVFGKKEDSTDVHSRNMRALGAVCVSRDKAKTFIYAWLLGASASKIKEIFGCSREEALNAIDSFVVSYEGLEELRRRVEWEAKRGFYIGFDGRLIKCNDSHFMMSGYLQSGEMAVMKLANIVWIDKLKQTPYIRYRQVNFVHDEFVTEVFGSKEEALIVKKIQEDSIRIAGEMFKLKCPMKGDGKVGKTWLEVH